MRRYCSIPDVFNLRKWFEKNFGEVCKYHDTLYANKIISRYEADKILFTHMISKVQEKSVLSRRVIYYPTCAATFIVVRLFGWYRYSK